MHVFGFKESISFSRIVGKKERMTAKKHEAQLEQRLQFYFSKEIFWGSGAGIAIFL